MGYIIGMDVSTKTIGVSLFEDKGESGKLLELTHVTPKIKPKPEKFRNIKSFYRRTIIEIQ
jgi:RNase H-fold protein (predicted Holliday junction resolvase)